eukprot:365656-Chlamydomonas_euryale.AAC.1
MHCASATRTPVTPPAKVAGELRAAPRRPRARHVLLLLQRGARAVGGAGVLPRAQDTKALGAFLGPFGEV